MKQWKKCRILLTLAVVCLFFGCGDSEKASVQDKQTTEQEQTEVSKTEDEQSTDASEEKAEEPQSEQTDDQNTDADQADTQQGTQKKQDICGSYFQEGNAMYRVEISEDAPGEFLRMHILRRDEDYSRYSSSLQEFHVPYEEGKNSYELEDEIGGASYQITFGAEGSVKIEGKSGEAEELGTYYSFEDNLLLPEAFDRPLCETDLLGMTKQDMKLLRNQFYAVYGRKFQSEDLKSYFEGKSWYQGTVEADDFSENTFGRLEKRNIAFLQSAEENFDEQQSADNASAYEALAQAPYAQLLPEQGEIAVSLHKDASNVQDKGIYYEVQGSISVPATVTVEEYKKLKQGEELEVTVDELTGETATLSKAKDSDYGYTYKAKDYENEASLSYSWELGCYYLWSDSDDTIFKRVYEGSIYVLKNAPIEYFGYFEMPEAEIPEYAADYGIMEFGGEDPDDYYWGNQPVWDAKGYLKALYFFGD